MGSSRRVRVLAVLATSVFAVALVVLGVWLQLDTVTLSHPYFGMAVALIVVSAVLGWIAFEAQMTGKDRAEWEESVKQFEECMSVLGAWLVRRLDNWEELSEASRLPPGLAEGPVWNWRERVTESGLNAAERRLLQVARQLYSRQARQQKNAMWAPAFHDNRRKMTRIADQWAEWSKHRRFREFIYDIIKVHRNVLIVLAFSEIALAETLDERPQGIAPWQRFGGLRPDLFAAPRTAVDSIRVTW